MFQCACRGVRPARVQTRLARSRPNRVSRLLRDRRRPRFLVAPAGFGKAMLAAEYAETVFGFRHVFWINSASPCFLRDLDEGVMARDLHEVDPAAALVVFVDVPLLDEERLEALGALIEQLVGEDVEVLATTSPAADGGAALGLDRIALGPEFLLLDDEELPSAAPVPLAERVACLQWGDEGPRMLAEGCAREELPSDVRVALWAMLAMGRGRRADLRALLGADRADEAWDHLAEGYPFLGIEEAEGSFLTAPLDGVLVSRAFARSLDAMARTVGFRRRDGLVCLIAERLAAMGEGERAGHLVAALVPRGAIGAWLSRCGWNLVCAGAAVEVCRLYDLASRTKIEERASVNAMVACAHGQLGHRSASLDFARKVTSATLAPPKAKAVAALCAWRQGNADVRSRASDILRLWLNERCVSADPSAAPLGLLAAYILADSTDEGPSARWVRLSRDLREGVLDDDGAQGCLVAAAWALDDEASQGVFERGGEERAAAVRPALAELCEWAAAVLADRLADRASLGYGGECAADALERHGAALAAFGLPRVGIEAALAARSARIRRERADAGLCERSLPTAVGALPSPREAMPLSVPLLEVRLFGGVRAFIGGKEVSASLLASRRARTLLALLVLHRGCEVAREELVAMLWPHAEPSTGRKSFYRLWQTLRDILSVDGSCPYLVRDRYGCRLDPELFTSDVMEFEDLVRQLLFGTTDLASGWERLYDRVRSAFSGDLAPAETSNEVIAEFRERFSLELTDGLVAASCRLRALGEPQGALWFARAALVRDGNREDAYAALMEAQVYAGQRGAAVATYHACRRHLADSLGLDPSRSLGELYQRVIEEAPLICD